jgi:hypothetical protein
MANETDTPQPILKVPAESQVGQGEQQGHVIEDLGRTVVRIATDSDGGVPVPVRFGEKVSYPPRTDGTVVPLSDATPQMINHAVGFRKLPPAQTSDRDGYWKQPTDEQIAVAARQGYDLIQQDKYFKK